MLHQTLTPSFVHFHPFSAPASFAPPLAAAALLHPPPPPSPTSQPPLLLRSFQAEREARMEGVEEEVMRKACRAEAEQLQPVFVLPDDVAWAVERGGFNGEDFSVDDLLDFNGLEVEKESEEAEAFAFEAAENYKTCASNSSAVTFEAPPLTAINLPTHDATEFEWMSSIIDDSPSEFPPCTGVPPYRPTTQSNTQLAPPPKTLCCTLSTEALVPVKAKRSKRPRTAGSAWPTVGVAAPSDTTAASTTTTTTTTTSSSPSSSCSSSPSYSSYLVTNHVSFLFDANRPPAKKHQPKKRGRKPKNHHHHHHHHPPPHTAASAVAGFGERHCTHCGAQKTPQWRTGPLGPKTLCNACGVRFKSGRLMPEYRPAASPTFVSHVHSNSHRKVLEMRRKKEEHHLAATPPF